MKSSFALRKSGACCRALLIKMNREKRKEKVVVSSSHMYLVHAVLVRSLRGHRGSRYIRGSFVADIADKGF